MPWRIRQSRVGLTRWDRAGAVVPVISFRAHRAHCTHGEAAHTCVFQSYTRACAAEVRSGPSTPPPPTACPHTTQSGGDSLASSSWHTIRWWRPHGDQGTRGGKERRGEPRRYKAYLGTAESPAMFTDTTMGEIELLSWAVSERCNLAGTHYPANYF